MRVLCNQLFLGFLVGLLLLTACGTQTIAQEQAEPASAGGQEAPGQQPDPEAVKLLNQIEAASAKITTFKTRVRFTRIQALTGDEQRRFGDFYYIAETEEGPTRFAVLFDRLVIDEHARPMQTWYIFDGRWLLERDHDNKAATRRELLPKGAERSDVLSFGERALPIPLKLKADEILKEYEVQKLEDKPFGEQTLHHLQLTPRRGGEDASALELWFDSKSLLLQKVVTEEDGDEIELLFPTPEVNPELDENVFDTALPDKQDGWQGQEVPLDR